MTPQWLIDAVKKFEGFEPVAQWDYKQFTNGYGTKALGRGEHITREEAEIRLLKELETAARYVDRFKPGLPEGMRAALISLTFNEGVSWEWAGLGQRVTAEDYDGAKNKLLQYNRAGGRVLPALVKRRRIEASWI